MDPLTTSVERCYEVFARYKLSGLLEVCTCPVCMTDETRRRLSETPLRKIDALLLSEYTHSAHGIPADRDELKYLLPRYLDLIARGDQPDHHGVGAVLSRFGSALRTAPDFLSEEERQAILSWAREMIAHTASIVVTDQEALEIGQLDLLEVLICGAVPAAVVAEAYQDAWQAPGGVRALAAFAMALQRRGYYQTAGASFDLWAVGYASDEERSALADWLGGSRFRTALEDAVLGAPANGLTDEEAWHVSALLQVLEYGPPPTFPAHER